MSLSWWIPPVGRGTQGGQGAKGLEHLVSADGSLAVVAIDNLKLPKKDRIIFYRMSFAIGPAD